MAEKEVEETEGKKSSKLIIIGALAVLLIGGAAGAYFFMGKDSEPVEAEPEVVETEELYYD